MKCPNCGATAPDGAVECPCGLIFAKIKAQREREKKEAAEFLAQAEAEPSQPMNPWIGRVVAVVLVLAWLVGMAVVIAMDRNRRAAAGVESGLAPDGR